MDSLSSLLFPRHPQVHTYANGFTWTPDNRISWLRGLWGHQEERRGPPWALSSGHEERSLPAVLHVLLQLTDRLLSSSLGFLSPSRTAP
ncbi:hypothetical protein NHX12_024480 [Muraenolepis orangiensis]|uniref:Uncharacterized protein n=1 Tax=Muraenolepis orangiensis TaxID=630683 RepID=A0A9Q0EHJ7_9TELE|nr:hypothetical protein NHX12_024480 [Muraenolepis orangiensis]